LNYLNFSGGPLHHFAKIWISRNLK